MNTLVHDCSKLGFGLMRLPKQGKNFDIPQCCRMVDAFLAAGGKYFDTAYVYGGSEEATRQALCDRHPRESYYLASKLNASTWACQTEDEAKAEIRHSLERTNAGYFDFYMLHGIDESNVELYVKYGLWDYIKELHAQGLIRHWGFSFHGTPKMLEELLTAHPDAEFVQLQINYIDWEDPGVASRECYEIATRHGKPVVVMEPVKGGLLANPPEAARNILTTAEPDASPASWAIRYAASLENVMVVLSGMSNDEQMRDNLSYMNVKDFRPLSETERKVLNHAMEAIKGLDTIPCTGCHYCTSGCPANIHIPEIFSVMNGYKRYGDLKRAKMDYGWRPGGAKASECLQCGQCEAACPQHLPIIQNLREIAQTLE